MQQEGQSLDGKSSCSMGGGDGGEEEEAGPLNVSRCVTVWEFLLLLCAACARAQYLAGSVQCEKGRGARPRGEIESGCSVVTPPPNQAGHTGAAAAPTCILSKLKKQPSVLGFRHPGPLRSAVRQMTTLNQAGHAAAAAAAPRCMSCRLGSLRSTR